MRLIPGREVMIPRSGINLKELQGKAEHQKHGQDTDESPGSANHDFSYSPPQVGGNVS